MSDRALFARDGSSCGSGLLNAPSIMPMSSRTLRCPAVYACMCERVWATRLLSTNSNQLLHSFLKCIVRLLEHLKLLKYLCSGTLGSDAYMRVSYKQEKNVPDNEPSPSRSASLSDTISS